MQLSMQVSVSELANTKDLLQRQNSVVVPHESFDCRHRSNRPCAAMIQNHVCRIVGKVQWSCHNPCSESGNRQSNDWRTNRLIPKRGHFLLHRAFLKLTIRIDERFLLCLFLLILSFALVLGTLLACTFVGLVRAKNHPSEHHHCLLTSVLAFRSFGSPSKVLF